MHGLEVSGNVRKRPVIVHEHDLVFVPHNAVRAPVLYSLLVPGDYLRADGLYSTASSVSAYSMKPKTAGGSLV